METRFAAGQPAADSRCGTHFLLMFAVVIRVGLGRAGNFVWPRIRDHLAGGFETENTGGVLSAAFWPRKTSSTAARCGGWDRGALPRSARWFWPCSPTSRRSDGGATRSRRPIWRARRSRFHRSPGTATARRRRLASAIETLNSDRDRLFSRVTVLEQGLDSVTGAIARQTAAPTRRPSRSPPGRRPRRQRCRPARPRCRPVATTAAAAPEKPHRGRGGGRAGSGHGRLDRTRPQQIRRRAPQRR